MMQKVMVIHDVSKEGCWSAIRWLLNALGLKPGDELIILGVVHHLNHPATFDFLAAAKQLGYETTVTNSNDTIEEELDHREEEQTRTHTYAEMLVLFKQCQALKVKLHVDLRVGVSRKVVVVETAKDLEATCVVLDREMKKEKKYFMKRLNCGILKVKSNNTAEQVRGPTTTAGTTTLLLLDTTNTSAAQMSYDEMIPSSQELAASSSSSKLKSLVNDTSKPVTTPPISSTESKKEEAENNNNNVEVIENVDDDDDEIMMKMTFSNSICSFCNNKRPKPGVKKKEFTYAELHEATDGFATENYLSEGGFGSVYKGKLKKKKNGVKIAVKQYKNMSLQGEKEFKSEVDVLSRARHENLVMLLGSCSQGSHRLLVYEYVCNGSLYDHLSSDAMIPLNWEQRLKIALGAAKGLEYLHAQKIIHRDIRPNNILITHDHESLLGDFGLARAKSSDDSNHFTNEDVVGTLGYVAPEYAESGQLSTKTDVYSFGVVLLQLLTGLSNTDKNLKGRSLVQWARPLLEQKNYPGLIDKRIDDSHDVHQLFGMVQLVEGCLRKDPNKRPPMRCVVDTLTDLIEGCAIGRCSPSKTRSIMDAIQITTRDDVKVVEDDDNNNEERQNYLSNKNNTSKSEKVSMITTTTNTHVKEIERKQIEVRRVGFKSSGTKPMRRNKLLYDEMIL